MRRMALWAVLLLVAGVEASPPSYEIALEEVPIPMPDGVSLAADLWRPKGANPGARFPIVLEYLPYRKDEERASYFSLYSYLVRRGYVVARVDIRGTGRSSGVMIPYEYSEIEHRDGDEVIAWLARQPFSNGNVGMIGISWSGFNSIQMAMRNPPALKAFVAVDATDDLYQDDVHFIDGMMHVDSWEMSHDLASSIPAAPDFRIDDAFFAQRFDRRPYMLTYKKQQRDGPFWDRASLKSNYASIRIPAFLVGGWYDGYRDSIPRMLEHVKAPVRAIVGAWNHSWPHQPYPLPGIEWRHEVVRFFDQTLKGRDTGFLQEPKLAVYVRQWHPPGPDLEEAPGEWRYEDGWPIPRIKDRTLYAQADHTLGDSSDTEDTHTLRYMPGTGIEASGPVLWFGDVAADQRPSDAWSLVYDGPKLTENVEILGLPRALLRVAADAPLAHWFARLEDVAPDGAVTLVASAGFNGAHRESAREPKALVPGVFVTLDVEMHFTSWVFPKGHRMRLAVSNAQWPMIWPTPYAMTTSLHLGGAEATRLLLPVVPEEVRPKPRFVPIEADEPQLPGYETVEAGTTSGYVEIESIDRNPQRHSTRVVATNANTSRYPWGEHHIVEKVVHEVEDARPEAASVRGDYQTTLKLGQRVLRFENQVEIVGDRTTFNYSCVKRLFENGALVREKRWAEAISRDFQ
jgi:uncharacterized protein